MIMHVRRKYHGYGPPPRAYSSLMREDARRLARHAADNIERQKQHDALIRYQRRRQGLSATPQPRALTRQKSGRWTQVFVPSTASERSYMGYVRQR